MEEQIFPGGGGALTPWVCAVPLIGVINRAIYNTSWVPFIRVIIVLVVIGLLM